MCMEVFVVFAVLAAFIFSVVGLIDRHIMASRHENLTTVLFISMLSKFIVFSIVFLFFGSSIVDVPAFIISVVAGFLLGAGILAYYKALSEGPVSLFSPITSLEAVFVALLAYFLIDDKLTVTEYVGMFILLFGVVVMSYKKGNHSNLKQFVFFAVLGAFLIGAQSFLVDVSGMVQGLPNVLFGIGIGNLFFATVLSLSEKKSFFTAVDENFKELLFVNTLALVGTFILYYAIIVGPAAIVVALLGFKHVFTYLATRILDYQQNDILKDHVFDVSNTRKIIGIAIVIAGTLFMTIL